MPKIIIASLGIPGVLSATEAASQLTRAIRSHDRSYQNEDIVQLPLVDGGEGTIDVLVTQTLGSFLEVETTDAHAGECVVPLGFAGEDGKLAIIEMKRAAGVDKAGDSGTTYGIGELIRDVLDEGAFSVLLGLDEPMACDAGLGAAAALGVKFFDAAGTPIEMNRGDAAISKIARVNASARSFELLSSRFFIGVTRAALQTVPSAPLIAELERLSEIILRDCNIHASTNDLTASAAAYGFRAFLGAEVQDGGQLVLDAARIEERMTETKTLLLFVNGTEQLEQENVRRLLDAAKKYGNKVVLLFARSLRAGPFEKGVAFDAIHSLADVQLFQPSLRADSGAEEVRRDLLMRIEKIMPEIAAELRPKPASKRHSERA